MNHVSKLPRRAFLRSVASALGSLSLLNGCAFTPSSLWLTFSNEEARLLGALADCIIPPDEWPGGAESGCVHYIDRQLAGPLRRFQDDYHKGLRGIESSCHSRFRGAFEDLSTPNQISFLQSMESGGLGDPFWKDGFDKQFFELVRSHCLQGFYGSPRHGGNNDYVSYRMLGLDYQPMIGQNRYRL